MRGLLIAIAAMTAAAVPATAMGASNLSYPTNAGPATVSGSPTAFSLTLAHPFSFVFPGTFDTDYEVTSPQGINNLSANCTEVAGSSQTEYRCEVPPSITNITGSPQGDTISAACGGLFFGSSPRMDADTGDGADTVTAACGSDTIDGGPGGDGIDAGSGNDNVEGGDGEDSLAGGPGADMIGGGPGDDSVQAGSGDDTATGGPGADVVAGGDGTDNLSGESGRDALAGGTGDDLLQGGADRDTLDGGDGNDTLEGGDGRDLLLPGTGTDIVRGGPSPDTVSYEDRDDGQPLRISLNSTADDGAPGENDFIEGDVENVIGSPGADTIVGNDDANDIDGGASNDTIEPAGGGDFVDAGPGDDRVTARDGAQDRIDCGTGVDTAIVDEFDVTSNCETVDASRELMSDVDNDGIPAPADCDDRNAAVRPGIPDVPGNGVDDDCLGGDAPFPRVETPVQFSFKVNRRFTRITRLVALDLEPGMRIRVRCRGGKKRGCFTKARTVRIRRAVAKRTLTRIVRKRKLRRGARIEVRVTRRQSVGKVVQLKIRKRKAPTVSRRCLQPGSSRPQRC